MKVKIVRYITYLNPALAIKTEHSGSEEEISKDVSDAILEFYELVIPHCSGVEVMSHLNSTNNYKDILIFAIGSKSYIDIQYN